MSETAVAAEPMDVTTNEDRTQLRELLQLEAAGLRKATVGDRVFKDECMRCFNTPYFPGGLFVCLKTFVGLCGNHIHSYAQKTGAKFFVNIRKHKLVEQEEPKDKVQRLCIRAEKEDSIDSYALVIYPDLDTPHQITPADGEHIYEVYQSVVDHISAAVQERLESGISEWDGEACPVTKHVENLIQIHSDKQIPYEGWQCEEDGCDLRENLWLNLGDGTIKQYLDAGVVTPGNGHMKIHYEANPGFPLIVKLGTITPEGDADIHSYDEESGPSEGKVKDPELAKHLAFFGLDITKFKKTEKSTLEMELDMNQKWEWSRCVEQGATLENVYGPGFTGLINIGSSCYMNSVLQTLLLVPGFVDVYANNADRILDGRPPHEAHDDFHCQLAKENYEFNAFKPTQFRKVAGRGHPEFSTAKQQDAEEYIRHLFDRIDDTVEGEFNPVNSFRFKSVTRFEDLASHKVRYSSRDDVLLPVPIPIELTEPIEVDGTLRKKIGMEQCIASALADEVIEGFVSPITAEPKGAKQSHRFGTFPDFLIVQLKRFDVDRATWEARKISDVDVVVPEEINLEAYRSSGLQPGEEPLPENVDTSTAAAALPQIDPNIVDAITGMGFTENAARKAAHVTQNAGVEPAINWVMEHMGDADINDPHPDLVPRSGASQASQAQRQNTTVAPELIGQLTALGFTEHQAKYSLERANADVNAAAEWLFMHAAEVPPETAGPPAPPAARAPKATTDGPGRYVLRGCITHMGQSPQSGHYVVHLKKDDRWYIFNDEKVAVSQNPPIQLGYIYIFQRL
ncbi:ubiquitin carboxyl-terminal hydrolase [Aphelenchoides avenae]|nr:ubiquitin carboxyl-terminal hydrolase [Aphelenchus avenae]